MQVGTRTGSKRVILCLLVLRYATMVRRDAGQMSDKLDLCAKFRIDEPAKFGRAIPQGSLVLSCN